MDDEKKNKDRDPLGKAIDLVATGLFLGIGLGIGSELMDDDDGDDCFNF